MEAETSLSAEIKDSESEEDFTQKKSNYRKLLDSDSSEDEIAEKNFANESKENEESFRSSSNKKIMSDTSDESTPEVAQPIDRRKNSNPKKKVLKPQRVIVVNQYRTSVSIYILLEIGVEGNGSDKGKNVS